MRESQTKKIPFTIIIGDSEKNNNTISFRRFLSSETTTLDYNEFMKYFKDIIESKK